MAAKWTGAFELPLINRADTEIHEKECLTYPPNFCCFVLGFSMAAPIKMALWNSFPIVELYSSITHGIMWSLFEHPISVFGYFMLFEVFSKKFQIMETAFYFFYCLWFQASGLRWELRVCHTNADCIMDQMTMWNGYRIWTALQIPKTFWAKYAYEYTCEWWDRLRPYK